MRNSLMPNATPPWKFSHLEIGNEESSNAKCCSNLDNSAHLEMRNPLVPNVLLSWNFAHLETRNSLVPNAAPILIFCLLGNKESSHAKCCSNLDHFTHLEIRNPPMPNVAPILIILSTWKRGILSWQTLFILRFYPHGNEEFSLPNITPILIILATWKWRILTYQTLLQSW